jgi:hypothetical protein
MMREPLPIPTDIVHFRNWLKAYLSHTHTAAYGLSEPPDEDEQDGYTYFGFRDITGEKRPVRGRPVEIRLLDSGDHSVVEIFSMADFAKFADNLHQAAADNWQVESKGQSKDNGLQPITDPTDKRLYSIVSVDPDLTDQEVGQQMGGLSRQNVNRRRNKLEAMGYKVR